MSLHLANCEHESLLKAYRTAGEALTELGKDYPDLDVMLKDRNIPADAEQLIARGTEIFSNFAEVVSEAKQRKIKDSTSPNPLDPCVLLCSCYKGRELYKLFDEQVEEHSQHGKMMRSTQKDMNFLLYSLDKVRPFHLPSCEWKASMETLKDLRLRYPDKGVQEDLTPLSQYFHIPRSGEGATFSSSEAVDQPFEDVVSSLFEQTHVRSVEHMTEVFRRSCKCHSRSNSSFRESESENAAMMLRDFHNSWSDSNSEEAGDDKALIMIHSG